jgi:hypothetical protein
VIPKCKHQAPMREDRGEPYVYYHIPKCGGTSIGENAKLNLGRRQVLSVYKRYLPLNLKAFEGYTHQTHIKLIKSHIPFGSVPAISAFRSFTILRDPEARIASLMQDVSTRPSHYLHDSLGGCDFSIKRFIENAPVYEIDNVLVRYLIGEKGFTKPEVDNADLQKAIHVLHEGLTWFGLQEDFENTLKILASELGFQFITKRRKNASSRKLKFSEDLRRGIESCIKFDSRLYEIATKLYAKRMEENPPAELSCMDNRLILAAAKIRSFCS